MNDPTPIKLKNPQNWFAAGDEMRRAAILLTDGAFKIFVYICLHAHRGTGTLETNQTELARKLNKSQANIHADRQNLPISHHIKHIMAVENAQRKI